MQNGTLYFESAPQNINFFFDQNIIAGADGGLNLVNLRTGATYDELSRFINQRSVFYSVTSTSTDPHASFYGSLDRGNYDATLDLTKFQNSAGEVGVGEFNKLVYFQPGDANHDRTVDSQDSEVLDSDVGDPTLSGYSNGDYNYDNFVTEDDYDVLNYWFGTTLQPPPTAPNTVNASGGPNLIDLQWTIPDGTPNPDGFGIWRSTDGNVTWQFYQQINDGTARSFRDTGLLNGTKYGYRIRAWTVAAGYSETSNPTWAVTSLPGPTNAPVVSNIKTHAATLTWDDNTTNEAGFFITVTAPDSTRTILEVPAHEGTGQQTFEVTGLSPNTQYSFQVQAYTDAQVSAFSPAATATTAAASVPGAPTNLSAVGGLGTVQLSWTPPVNAIDLDEYQIERSTDGGATFELYDSLFDDSATTWTDSDVADGTAYAYRLTAISLEAGASAATDPVTATTDMPGPTAAPIVSLLGSTSLTLSWDDNATNETGFEISALDGNHAYTETIFQAPAHDGTGQQSFTLTGLEPSDNYILSVRAKTDAQVSAWSPYASPTTLPSGVPSPPSNLTATSGNWYSVALSWQDNSTDENGFTIQQLGPDGVWTTIGTTAAGVANYTVSSGVSSSTNYDFRVLADGAGGSSGTGDFGGGGDSADGGGGSGDDGSSGDGSSDDGGPGDADNYASATTQEAFGELFLHEDSSDDIFQPITRQWSGGINYDDGDAASGYNDSPVTLQLSGLPAHGALILTGIYDYSEDPNSHWQVSVDGQPVSDVGQLNTGFWIAHTGGTASIEITNLQDFEGGQWVVPNLEVDMDTPNLSMGSATMGVGDEQDVTVTAIDHGLMNNGIPQAWPDALTPTVQNSNSGAVSVEGSPTIAAGAGTASLTLRGIEAGIATMMLKVDAMGATSQPATDHALKIVQAMKRPSAQEITNLIAALADPNYSKRQAAQEKLADMLSQYPDLKDQFVAARNKTADPQVRQALDALMSGLLLALTVNGNQFSYAAGPGIGTVKIIGGTVSIVSGDGIGLKTPDGEVVQTLARNMGPGATLSGNATLVAQSTGQTTVTVTIRATTIDENGQSGNSVWKGECNFPSVN